LECRTRGKKDIGFLGFQASPAHPYFTNGINIQTLDWREVVASDRGPRDFELLVNLKEKNYLHFVFIVSAPHRKRSVLPLERKNIIAVYVSVPQTFWFEEFLKNFTISEGSLPKCFPRRMKKKKLFMTGINSYLGPPAHKHVHKEAVPLYC
jgi:hypothetical protein